MRIIICIGLEYVRKWELPLTHFRRLKNPFFCQISEMKIDLLLQIEALYWHVGNIKEPQKEEVGVFYGF